MLTYQLTDYPEEHAPRRAEGIGLSALIALLGFLIAIAAIFYFGAFQKSRYRRDVERRKAERRVKTRHKREREGGDADAS